MSRNPFWLRNGQELLECCERLEERQKRLQQAMESMSIEQNMEIPVSRGHVLDFLLSFPIISYLVQGRVDVAGFLFLPRPEPIKF